MMAMVAIINPMPVVQVVGSVRIVPVVAVWITIVSRITIIIARVSNPDSHDSWDSDVNLSVRTLRRNKSESNCHQCNYQGRLGELRLPFPLFYWIRYESSRGSPESKKPERDFGGKCLARIRT